LNVSSIFLIFGQAFEKPCDVFRISGISKNAQKYLQIFSQVFHILSYK
jgi:hypothetical protein